MTAEIAIYSQQKHCLLSKNNFRGIRNRCINCLLMLLYNKKKFKWNKCGLKNKGTIWTCPTIPISSGLSQFCLKILNPDQYAIGIGKIRILTQRAKKVVPDSLGLVDFAIGLVNSVINLPNGQVKLRNSNYRRTVKSICSSKHFLG